MKRLLISLVLVVALAVVSSGCFHNRIVTSPEYDPGQTTPDHEELRLHVIGLVPLGSPVNLDDVCPQGAGVVETRFFLNLSVFSIGQARVHCSPTGADGDENLEQKLTASN